jgi:hypothetical protein
VSPITVSTQREEGKFFSVGNDISIKSCLQKCFRTLINLISFKVFLSKLKPSLIKDFKFRLSFVYHYKLVQISIKCK